MWNGGQLVIGLVVLELVAFWPLATEVEMEGLEKRMKFPQIAGGEGC